ncbi:MAG: acyl-CoA dehydratase activase [candidate division WOR-3 bacterium]
MLIAGIDVGSVNTKVVLYDADAGEIRAFLVTRTGMNPKKQGEKAFNQCLRDAGIEMTEVKEVVATGYARHALHFTTKVVTEITATAWGVRYWHPSCRTVIDIGGQDSKVLTLNEEGGVDGFQMNDRCAAGTGSFLEFIARSLEIPIEEFGRLSLSSQRPVLLSSLCVVMAESEILSLVAADTPREDIIAGLHQALAARVVNMAARLEIKPEVVFAGGTALNEGMRVALERTLGLPVAVAKMPMLVAALGAALLGSAEDNHP